jgi:FixJ family two-component response regulator
MNDKVKHLISLITVVDDDRSVRQATTGFLLSNGFRAEVFGSAEEFLTSPLLEETKCLILDVQMPGISGLELQRRLTAGNYRIPIIFITAHQEQEIRNQAMLAGAVDFLAKPVNERFLLHAIHSALADTN